MVSKTSTINILIVSNQKSTSAKLEYCRLEYLLSSASEFKIIGMAEDILDALVHTKNLHPDIIIMDIEMLQIDDLVTNKVISEIHSNTKILVLSNHDKQEYITQSISAGATGYLLKNASDEEIKQTIRFVRQGYTVIRSGLEQNIVPTNQRSAAIRPNLTRDIISISSQSLNIHPSQTEIDRPDSKNLKGQILAWLILNIILITGVYAMRQWLQKPIPSLTFAEQSARVEVTKFSGKIKPAKTFKIAAINPSVVENIQVKVGEEVTANRTLLTLKNLAAENEKKRIIQEQQLTKKQQQIILQQQQIAQQRSFEMGQKINRLKYDLTPLKAQIAEANLKLSLAKSNADKLPLRQRQDSIPRTKAVYERAEGRFNRLNSLYQRGGISQEQLEKAQVELEVAKVDYDMAIAAASAVEEVEQSQIELSKLQKQLAIQEQQDAISELEKQRQAINLEYQQATEKLELVSKQAAQLSEYQIPQAEKIVKATKAGIVTKIPVTVGEQIYAGNPVIELAQLDILKVEIPVSNRLINGLNHDRRVIIHIGTGISAQRFEGKIATINPLPTENLDYLVEVEFANPNESMMIGQLAQVQFLSDVAEI